VALALKLPFCIFQRCRQHRKKFLNAVAQQKPLLNRLQIKKNARIFPTPIELNVL
jgi:hypothetical protein